MAIVAGNFRRPGPTLMLRCLAVCSLLLIAAAPLAGIEPTGKPATSQPSSYASNTNATSPPHGIADLKALESRIQRTVAAVSPSVVWVAGGSGVVVNSDGTVLTVAHVAQQAGRNIMVIFPDGRRARAVTLGNDHGVDAGMVKITDRGPWPHAEMGSSADLKPGQWCITLGYPVMFERGRSPVVRIGRVLRNGKTETITDCTIMGGDSGAPLFNLDGKVIGIGTKCINSLVYNIHVPVDRYRDGWQQLAKGEDFDSLEPNWGLLGVDGEVDAEDARIGIVLPNSSAARAGVMPGDLLLKFGGKELRSYADLAPLLRQYHAGDKVEIELRRRNQTLQLQVTLGPNDTRKDQ